MNIHPNLPDREFGTVSVFESKNLPLEIKNWIMEPTKENLLFHEMEEKDAGEVEILMQKAGIYAAGEVKLRLRKGSSVYTGRLNVENKKKDGMVVYGWSTTQVQPMGDTGFAFQPPPGDAYLYDFSTLPDFRGRGIYPALLRFILNNLALKGIKRAWIGTAPGNSKSARSIIRAGFLKVADSNFIPPQKETPAKFELIMAGSVDQDLFEAGKLAHVYTG